jgi:hypothetical protein
MSGEVDQNAAVALSPVDLIIGGYSTAQTAAEEVIESILEEGGRLLYQSYIEKKSFSFASESITKLLVSELQLCFVRHDEGEPSLGPSERPGSKPSVNASIDLRPSSALSSHSQHTINPADPGCPKCHKSIAVNPKTRLDPMLNLKI